MILNHKPPFILHELKIEVTYRCDLNCIHCSSDATPSNAIEMSCEDCIDILKQASIMGVKEVTFSGGEPLIWPHINDAVKAAIKNDMRVTIYTSGNCDSFRQKAKELFKYGASRCIFSMFGATAIMHERITRTKNSFNQTLNSILEANKIGFTTEVHFVPMAYNYQELTEIAAISKNCGASVVSVLRLVTQGRAVLLRERTLNRLQNIELRKIIQYLRKSGYNIRTGSPYNILMLNDNPKCCAAIDRIIIAPDLKLYPCDAFKCIKAEELVGTINNSRIGKSNLKECWDKSPYFESIRQYLTTPFSEPCASCRSLSNCLSGCLAQKVLSGGNLEKRPDPDCLLSNL